MPHDRLLLMSDRLANRLKEERARLALTQADLADRIGVSRKTINTIENGVFIPSTLLALKLALALDRRVEDVFWLEPRPEASARS